MICCIAFHSGVVWVDATFSNMLPTDDLHVVLSDFGGSSMLPEYFLIIYPSMVWMSPPKAWPGHATAHHDRYGYGVALSVLLLLRWPHTPTLFLENDDSTQKIYDLQSSGHFDAAVTDEEFSVLADVVRKCWQLQYATTDDMRGMESKCWRINRRRRRQV
jgi:serine/threonine protein kinase